MSEADAHEVFQLGEFEFDCGVSLPQTNIAFKTYGTLNQARDNVIVFPTWFIGTHNDLEWLIGEGKPLDSERYFIVAPSMFANGLSSSPSNTSPPFDRGRFPAVTIQDNVRAQHRLLTEKLDVRGIELAIGGSMGAFQAYQWALQYPAFVRRLLASCGAARVSPHCYVFLAGAKAALLADPTFADGDYDAPPEAGMRAMARVWAGWALSQQFYREGLYKRMEFDDVDSFLVDFWEAFWMSCDANNLLNQLNTWQTADISKTPGYDGDLVRALGDITAKATLTPGQKDLYFPAEDMAWEAEHLPNGELRTIPGPWGHFSEVGIDPECSQHLGDSIRLLLSR